MRYRALLDACELHAIAMAEVVMSLAVMGLFIAKRTPKIKEK